MAIQLHKYLPLVLLLLFVGLAFQFHLSSTVFAKDRPSELVDQRAGTGLSSQILLTEKEQAWLDRRHTVRVRIGNVPPYHMSAPEPQGISVDYLKLIGKRFGINFIFVTSPVDWREALDDLTGARKWCDLLATIARTPEREQEISFTEDYIFSPWVIINRTDADFVSRMQDLNGKSVAVERGFIISDRIKAEYPQIKIVLFNTSIDALRSVATGVTDAYVGNLAGASYLINYNGLKDLKIAAPTPFGTHNQAMGVRKDWPELTSIINKALVAMPEDKESEIRNRWLSIRYEYGVNMKQVWSWVGGLTATFLLVFAVILIWNRRLKIEIEKRKKVEAALQESHAKLERNLKGAIDVISETIERKGPNAPGYHRSIVALASAIAREMGLTDFQVRGIELAAAVYDIGLMTIPIEFLQDNERLDGIKLTLYQGYPQVGHDALKKIEFPWPIAEIILQHRECYDGSGFPQGIKGEEILIEARILAVTTALKDLTTHKSFRNAFPINEALEEISSHSGSKYDSKVVDACLRLFQEKGYRLEGT